MAVAFLRGAEGAWQGYVHQVELEIQMNISPVKLINKPN